MRTVLRWLLFFAWWPACWVGITALINLFFDSHESLWIAGGLGTFMGFWMIFMLENQRRGWIKGLMLDPAASEQLARGRKELADEREQIIADAKAKHSEN